MARLEYTEGRLPANIFRVMAHAPEVERGYLSLGGRLLGETALDPKLRELVICGIAVQLNAAYEWGHHAKQALEAGATPEELEGIRSGDLTTLGPLERDCVAYARKVDDRMVTDADIDRLRELGLDSRRITELTVLAGFYGMTARFLLAMDVEPDEGTVTDFEMP